MFRWNHISRSAGIREHHGPKYAALGDVACPNSTYLRKCVYNFNPWGWAEALGGFWINGMAIPRRACHPSQ